MSGFLFNNANGTVTFGAGAVVIKDDTGLTIKNTGGSNAVTLSATASAELTITGSLKFSSGSNLNLNQNFAQNFRVENFATGSLPSGGNKGRLVCDSTANTLVFDNGASLVTLATVPRRRLLNYTTDAVPGQAGAYYLDKGATALGYNVAVDPDGVPLIHVFIGGVARFWGPTSDFNTAGVPADFDIIRSLSTGPEGFSAAGSRNAIVFNSTPTQPVWYYYTRASQAVP